MYLLDLRHYVAWFLKHGSCIMHLPTTRKEIMTQQEVMEALDKAGIDYDYVEGFEDSMHVIIKFEPEEKND